MSVDLYQFPEATTKRRQKEIYAVLDSFAETTYIVLERAPHSKTPRGTLILRHTNKHAIAIKLRWKDNSHYVGYLINQDKESDGDESHAIVSLYTAYDASQFVIAFGLFAELRSRNIDKVRELRRT